MKEETKDKKNKGSFGSDASFESFGSMEENEPVIIVNPNTFTQEDEDNHHYDIDKIEEADK